MHLYPIDRIVIGDRVRKDMGDLDALMASIRAVGLLHPVVIKPDGTLVAGHRRVEAVKRLGQAQIPVTVIDAHDLLRAERDENEARKDFTRSEAVAIARMIEEQERPLALQRLREGAEKSREIKTGSDSGNLPEAVPRYREVADVAAAAVGMSRHTYKHAKAVIDAAARDPGAFGDLPDAMDATGNVNGTHQELKRRLAGEPPTPDFTGTRHHIRAESHKRRLEESLSSIYGHCRGLKELNLPMALSVCSKEEVHIWSTKARDLSRALRNLAASMSKGTPE